jgi:hypothetical protein
MLPESTLTMEIVPSKIGKNYTASHNIHPEPIGTFLQNVGKHTPDYTALHPSRSS